MRTLEKFLDLMLVCLLGFTQLAAAGTLQRRVDDCYSPISPSSPYKKAPGYFVTLEDGYEMPEHFEKVGSIPDAVDLEQSGYFAELTDDQMSKICQDPKVKRIWDNSYGILADLENHNASTEPRDSNQNIEPRAEQPNAGWALAYLSANRKNPPQPYTYHHLDNAGEGVDIYIVDSGINDLDEFGGRLERGKSYVDRRVFHHRFRDNIDHGTRVAVFAGGTRFGTSRKATLWDYRVMDNRDNSEAKYVVKALKDIIKQDKSRRAQANYRGAVINISLGLDHTDELQKAVELAIKAQIAVVTSAGNDNVDASSDALCSYGGVHCVGAINEQYERSWFSNHGDKVTIWAPGEHVLGYHSDRRLGADSRGTSFAAPFVSGIIATFYGREGKVERVRESPVEYGDNAFNNDKAHERLKANAMVHVISGDHVPPPGYLATNGFLRSSRGYVGAPEQAPQACNVPRDGHRSDCQTETESQTGTTNTEQASATTSASTSNIATSSAAATTDKPATTGPIPWPTGDVQISFPSDQADQAIKDFQNACNEVLEKPSEAGERAGCIMSDQPTQLEGAGDEDLPTINLSVEQIWWVDGQTSVDDVGGQILNAMARIQSESTIDDDQVIGGWTITGDDDRGYLQWNMTGLAEKADTPPGFIVGVALED